MFKLLSKFKATDDQQRASGQLVHGLNAGRRHQTLVGVTGSGKTFTLANVIAHHKKPTLVISHNKTLAAQLYQEFKEFFPENSVHYFVSYYDYYQPEAYLPATDTYIEKDAKINEFIDRLRHGATQAALTRRDFIVVASVSCIYGIGDPEEYKKMSLDLRPGIKIRRSEFLEHLADLQYERNDFEKKAGSYSVKGEVVEIISPDGETVTRIEFFGDNMEALSERKNSINSEPRVISFKKIFPAKHFVMPKN